MTDFIEGLTQKTIDLYLNTAIDEARSKYVMPDDPEMKMGMRFKSNNRILEYISGRQDQDLEKGIRKSIDEYLEEAFDKMCELDWHYSNKEKWQ